MSRVTRAKSLLVLMFVLPLLLLAICPALAAPEPAGWYQQPSGTTTDISNLSAVSPEVAWGAWGDMSNPMRTVDGGDHWAPVTGQMHGGVQAVDANTAWAGGIDGIYKTTDGGATWTKQFDFGPLSIHYQRVLTGICAVDANTCWACGWFWYMDTPPYTYFGWVIRTTDGGLNWSSGNTWDNSICTGISAVDANTAWICGGFPSTNSSLMKTVDGGQNWAPQGPLNPIAIPYGISAVDADHAFAFAIDFTSGAALTPKSLFALTPEFAGSSNPKYPFALTPSSTPEHAYILRTTDGSNWDTQDMGTDHGLRGIDAVGPNAAWVVGTGGTILHTSDGTNWTAQDSGTTNDLFCISAVDSNTAWAGGAKGTLLHTTGGTVQPPAPASISPASAVQTTVAQVTITGTDFQGGATSVRLDGPAVVNATNVNVVSSTQINCTLDLRTAPPPLGKYDVVVRNSDGQEGKLVKGFSVTNICGGGAGASIAVFGCVLGLLSIAGTSRLVRRKRKR